jgi:hypothetical protein
MVQYYVDAFPAVSTDYGALAVQGMADVSTGFTLQGIGNSYNWWNGRHTAYAVALDALGNVLATSSTNSFTIANTYPCSYVPGFSVATSTGLGSNWTGTVTVTPTVTGTGASHFKNLAFTVDGIAITSDTSDTDTSFAFSLDTTKFFNGKHIIAVNFFDKTGGTTFSGDGAYVGYCGEWSGIATFSNSATPTEVWSDAYEMFLAPTRTHQLVPILVNTDSTTVASPTFVYFSENTNVATVSSGGLVTALTPPSPGPANAQIDIIAETVINATDLACVSGTGCPGNTAYTSSSHPFGPQDLGKSIVITSTNGWTAGTYKISFASTSTQITLNLCTNGSCAANNPGLGSTGNGTFSTGPTRTVWAFVNSTNAIYHFGSNASILSSYTPGTSMFVTSIFASAVALPVPLGTDQPYPSQGITNGFAADYHYAGFTNMENGLPAYPAYGQSQTAWQNATAATIARYATSTAPYTFKWTMVGDGWERTDQALFDATRGQPFTGWSPAPYTTVVNDLHGIAITVEAQDEVQSAWNFAPLETPLNPGTALTSISALSGICTINGTIGINSSGHFIISGSATTNMNSVNPAVYSWIQSNPYKFNCTGVADGTYNSGNDPGLTLWPFAVSWRNNTNGTTAAPNDYIQGAFSQFKTWINAATSGRPKYTWPNAAGTTCQSIYNWNNPGGGLADYATLYYTGFGGALNGSHTAINPFIANIGAVLRGFYGCFSPNAPLYGYLSGTSTNYGFQGGPTSPCTPANASTCGLAVSSFTGNTITFSSPHGLSTIIPGVSRVTLSGMSTTADNRSYYVISTPTATTMTVAMAATNFTATGAGGTITFSPSGASYTLAASNATGGTVGTCNNVANGTGGTICSDTFSTSTLHTDLPTHRGETATMTGVGAGTGSYTTFNSTSFYYLPENGSTVTTTFGNHWRQIPVGSSTSGYAIIVPDNNAVIGRSGTTQGISDPPSVYASIFYELGMRIAGYRLYNQALNTNGTNPAGGFTTAGFQNNAVLGDTDGGRNQLYLHPRWENYLSVPNFHAAALANQFINSRQSLILTTSMNSPDYGRRFECFARSGSAGNAMWCVNMTNATQTIARVNTSAYLESGQNFIQWSLAQNGNAFSIVTAGTASLTNVVVPAGGTMFLEFPATYAGYLQQPTISAGLADVTNATDIVVRYGYDPYLIAAGNVTQHFNGASSLTLNADRNIGPIYYRLIYLNSSGAVLATSDILNL